MNLFRKATVYSGYFLRFPWVAFVDRFDSISKWFRIWTQCTCLSSSIYRKKNQSDCQAASELHCDDPQMTLQNQTSTVELIGKDEPDGGGIKTNLKENESDSHKIDIDKGGESKDGCNVEFKKAPIVLTTDL